MPRVIEVSAGHLQAPAPPLLSPFTDGAEEALASLFDRAEAESEYVDGDFCSTSSGRGPGLARLVLPGQRFSVPHPRRHRGEGRLGSGE